MKQFNLKNCLPENLPNAFKKAIGTTNQGLKPTPEEWSKVSEIIAATQKDGDLALLKYALEFDGFKADTASDFLVTAEAFEAADYLVSDALKKALAEAKANITAYHQNQRCADWSFSPAEGILLGQRVQPIARVALYIPGGKAAYPSTVLMNGIPAQIAGVSEIAIFTPPDAYGKINPLVLYAAKLLGITEVYKLGGAQAIAAAAYGTETIPAVDKIVGPGNRYVALAKKMVFGDVSIDMVAGPSEVLIIADASAPPEWVAADLLAQAEHDENATTYLVTTEENLPSQVETALKRQLKTLPKSHIASASIQNNFYSFIVDSVKSALILSNIIAPEHLELMILDPFSALEEVRHAGSVFLGPYTPEALGDYFAGTNHTLPTSGTARFSSPLGVYDFIKRPSFLSYSREALLEASSKIEALALAEGLEAHQRSIAYRKEDISNDSTSCQ